MSDRMSVGRHRSADPYSPVAELSTIVRTAAGAGARASAVLAASGGLAAAVAVPAHGHPALMGGSSTSSSASSALVAATPAAFTTSGAAQKPAVVAPEVAAPVASDPVGVAGIKAVAKPKPEPKPKAETEQVVQEAVQERSRTAAASRSVTRSAPAKAVPQSSSQVVNIARGLLGIPYSYGGTSPSTGFDCSGFTSYVFGKAGISLPRTASQQQAAATPVSDPQPGDLVFFGSPAWHVGIYTGNGMMIDSPREGKSTSERSLFSGVSGYGRF
ncbi:C40 family peptidase [Phycicoccus sp. CSK15P-2]|uniref:C40 family peptidase n=1 Tax=Phycicoccus sp. CSK15P-2 TaxID=2807627 RepID=UPI00195240E7|nr:C40 family peptidase [Phycicoccus sp. CSK15P-2]MBM6403267.1 C40 family peptidase [Phycicoccus sp. CSK15P-2]